ncbi:MULTISPECIES: hypothetical protein [Lactobacillaceae]|uniref:hypothetical protein n=1 Tax=Lactobacillaceae TaxID=33958 RepID=UPI001F58C878|nr:MULTISPECIES: hypothetical protein [Lactobacillaceae]
MYFKKLEELEKTMKNDLIAIDAIQKLDIWLINLSHENTKYINPLQFATDYNIIAATAAHIIEKAYKLGLFKKFYRVISPRMEPLIDGWSKESIEAGIENNEIYSIEEDSYIPVSECQFVLYYRLVDTPSNLPKYITEPKKVRAPLYSDKTVKSIGNIQLCKEYEGAW